MADPSVVQVVIDELKAHGLTVRPASLSRGTPPAGVAIGDVRKAVGDALDSGFTGPTIVNYVMAYGDDGGVPNLEGLVRQRKAEQTAQAEADKKIVARAEAGFVTAAPQPPPSGGQPSAPAAGKRTAFDMLKEQFPADGQISITRDGTAIVRVGSDEYAYDISGPSPIITAVNGKPYGAGGAATQTGPNGGFGFAPQAKSSGVLPSGRPYVFDPNAPRGSQFADGITGGPLSPADFNALPAQIQGNDGNLYFVDPLTKAVTKGPLIGFAGIDPAVTAAESKRRFDVGEAGQNARATQSEQEANRRALLSAQSQGFQSVNQLAPQLGTLALNQANFTKDTLRSATDYLARAFFQQGQTSPLPQVSQADINNQVADLFTRYNQTLSGFNAGTPAIGGFQTAPAGGVPPATQPGLQSFTPPEGSANPSAAGLAGFLAANPGFGGNLQPAAGATPASPAVGLTFDPTGGPTGQGGWTRGGAPVADAFAAFGQPAPAVAAPAPSAPAPQISFAPPQLPVPPRMTDTELRALERSVRPPAVNAVMSGESAKPPLFGFSLPTVQNLNSLTTEDKQAYNTALGTQFNETLDNVQNEVTRRTRNPEARRRAVVTEFQ